MADDRSGTRRSAVGAALGMVVSAPVASWWLSEVFLVEPESVPAGDAEPDVLVAPLPLGGTAEQVVGWVALAVAVGSTALVVLAVRRGALDRRWVSVLAALAGIGGLAGIGWSWITVPTIGANIGAGLYVIVAAPVAAGLALWAAWRTRRLLAAADASVAHRAVTPLPPLTQELPGTRGPTDVAMHGPRCGDHTASNVSANRGCAPRSSSLGSPELDAMALWVADIADRCTPQGALVGRRQSLLDQPSSGC